MEKKSWTLLVLASARGESLTPIQIQKALFLIGQTVPATATGEFYTFKPYNYGPFSSEIYSDAELLVTMDHVQILKDPARNLWNYRATEKGLQKAKVISSDLGNETTQYIEKLVSWIRSLTFKQLLAFVYKNYPDWAVNSMFSIKK